LTLTKPNTRQFKSIWLLAADLRNHVSLRKIGTLHALNVDLLLETVMNVLGHHLSAIAVELLRLATLFAHCELLYQRFHLFLVDISGLLDLLHEEVDLC